MNFFKTGIVTPRYRFDGAPVEDPPEPSLAEQIKTEMEKRYQPRSVREWLANHKDDAELALEKAVDMLNDRVQRQIRTEVESQVKIKELTAQINTKNEELKTITAKAAELEANEVKRTAAEREAAINGVLAQQFPNTQKALALAIRNEGYTLELDGKEVMAAKDGKRHKLATILTDEFYKEYPFARPSDENPLGAPPQGDADLGEQIVATFAQTVDMKPTEWN